jgi:hypothetical protein
MPCLVLFLVLLFPRIVLALLFLSSTYLERAYGGSLLIPLAGFIVLPLTTIVYAWLGNSGVPTTGFNLLWLLFAVIIDLGGIGGGARHRYRK